MMLRLLGVAERAKLGGAAVTVRLIVVVCVKFPEVPVMVTMAVPVEAALLAVKVSVLVAAVGLALNDAVTPLGSPEADRLTLLVKPFCGVTVIVLVPLAPWTMLRLFGEEDRAKLPAGFTVSAIVALLLSPPEVPVTVTEKVPTDAVPVADRVNRLVAVVGFVPKLALTPVGRPVAVKFTLPLKPLRGLMAMVLEPAAPSRMVKLVGDAERVKLG